MFCLWQLKVLPIQGPLMLARGCQKSWVQGEKKGLCEVARAIQSCGTQRGIPDAHLADLTTWSTIDNGETWIESTTDAGKGIEADLVIYITAQKGEICKRSDFVMSYSGVCQRDQQDRPVTSIHLKLMHGLRITHGIYPSVAYQIAGYINFCSDRVEKARLHSKAETGDILQVAHELVHILGFSKESFAYFRDEYGSPRTPRCPGASGCSNDDTPGHPPKVDGKLEISSNTLAKSSERGRAVERIVSPAVQEIAREHYGCSDLAGAELEDSISIANGASHWEKRVLMTDIMTSFPDQNPTGDPSVVSAFTLALLQDSGWYEVDFDKKGTFTWGLGLGCPFAEDKCNPADSRAWCSSGDEVCLLTRTVQPDYRTAIWCTMQISAGEGINKGKSMMQVSLRPNPRHSHVPLMEGRWVLARS